MKKLLIFLLISISIYGQEERLELKGTLTHDFINNPIGGLQNKTSSLSNLDLVLGLSLGSMGTFRFHSMFNNGESLSLRMGDLQVANNFEASKGYSIYELWYQYNWEKGAFKIGQQDINSTFQISTYGFSFINSSFGFTPDLVVNQAVSTFPSTSLGAYVNYELQQALQIRAGLFDGDPGWDTLRPWGERLEWDSEGGTFLIAELEWQKRGQHKVGWWQRRYAVGVNKSQGYYAIGDIPLTSKSIDDKGLGFFYQLAWAGKEAAVVSSYWGVGFLYRGVFTDNKDSFGIAFANTQLSQSYRNQFSAAFPKSEQVWELTYRYQPLSYIRLQPNWQYVVNPASDVNIPNASVWMLRIQIGAL